MTSDGETTEFPSARRERLHRWWRLTLKELRETLRDRRTIITLVLMPLLVYPLLGVAFQQFLLTSLQNPEETVILVGVEDHETKAVAETFLSAGEAVLRRRRAVRTQSPEGDNARPTRNASDANGSQTVRSEQNSDYSTRFRFQLRPDIRKRVASGDVDVGIRLSQPLSPEQLRRLWRAEEGRVEPLFRLRIPMELVHREDSLHSQRALTYVERCLETLNDEIRVGRLRSRGIPRDDVPAHISYKRVEPAVGGAPFSIGTLIPLILILMTITGAVYPAIDLTAGERERGTLEMLIAAPVPRMGLLLAKYATVVLVAVLTATVNLLSMTLTVLATGLGPLLFGEKGLSLFVVVQVFGLLILFAMFFSALLLALTSFARSFKEAQAYLIPLMLVSIAPGVLSMIPNLKLTALLAVTPLANMVLLARDLFQGTVNPLAAVMVILSTGVYALAAILIAAKIFGTDAILYGSPGTWSDLFRRPEQSATACSPLAAVMALAVAFPLSFLLNQFAGQWFGAALTFRLVASGIVTMLVFGGIPVVVAVARNVRLVDACSFRLPHPLSVIGGVLLGLSLWPFAFELIQVIEELGLVRVSPVVKEYTETLAQRMQDISPWLVLTMLAVLPAVFEELFFRGLLLSSLQASMGRAKAVCLSAVAFAAFHVIVMHYLAVERLLPSLFLGLILGWLCVRTGSLWPGVLLHACHNGFLLLLIYFRKTLKASGLDVAEATHLPVSWLVISGTIAVVGFGVIVFATGKDSRGMQ